jgi:DNA-directed RNA polymerase subunit RPC12/RpoP
MADYIEKEQLKHSIKRYFKHLIDKGKYKIDVLDANADINKIIKQLPAIERLPAADVVKEKHGKWKMHIDDYQICATEFVCSNCKESFCSSEITDAEFTEMMKYCPNCGAKIEGVENE